MSESTSAIEYGPRTLPFLHALRPDLIDGKELIFIERDQTYIEKLDRELKFQEVQGRIITGDAANLDFQENHIPPASTIFAKNMFGQEGAWEATDSGTTKKTVEVGDINQIAQNWYENSVPGAHIILLEEETPANQDEIKRKFQEVGFTLKEEYSQNEIPRLFNPNHPNSDTQMIIDAFKKPIHEEAYALVFEKRP